MPPLSPRSAEARETNFTREARLLCPTGMPATKDPTSPATEQLAQKANGTQDALISASGCCVRVTMSLTPSAAKSLSIVAPKYLHPPQVAM